MSRLKHAPRKAQSGALGVFICVALVIVFGLIGLQNITSTSLDLYLSNSKQHIEEARQLAYAGLRHYTHNFGNDDAIGDLITTHKDDSSIIGKCSYTVPLPDTLTPQVELAKPSTPENTRQEISIRGVIVPYNCNRVISDDNYRATFEIVASVNCASTIEGVNSDCVKRSFVFNRQDDDDGKLIYKPIADPPPPPPPPPPPKPPGEPEPEPPSGGGSPPPDEESEETENPKPRPPKSKGKHEVGF